MYIVFNFLYEESNHVISWRAPKLLFMVSLWRWKSSLKHMLSDVQAATVIEL